MTTQPKQEPTLSDVICGLQDIKAQLAKQEREGKKALWLTPLAFGAALIAMGFHNDWVFWVVGAGGILYSFGKLKKNN